jgi:hypothetical protein
MLWSVSSILEKEIDDLLLRGVAQLIHTRAEEGGFGTADGKRKKMEKSKDSVQRAMQIAENASMDQTYMILDMRGQ